MIQKTLVFCFIFITVVFQKFVMGATEDEIILEVEGTPLICNKQQLISNSDYFKVLLEGEFLEHNKEKIELKDVTLKSMENILASLNGTTTVPKDDILDALETANYLQFEKITQQLSNQALSLLSITNCLKIWTRTQPLNIKPLYQEAKFLALKKFSKLKDGEAILDLSKEEIYEYLGDVQLRTDSEYSVFKTAIRWWQKNRNATSPESSGSLTQLLHCTSFRELEVDDLKEILENTDVFKDDDTEKILQCLLNMKSNKQFDNFSKEIQIIATNLNNSKRRLKLQFPWFFTLVQDRYQLVYYDNVKQKFKKFTDLDLPKRSNKFMINVEGYGNQYISILVKREGPSMWDLWIYDVLLEKLEKKAAIPYEGEYFKSTIVGNKNYITETKWGNTVIIYDMKNETYSHHAIPVHKEKDLQSIELHLATYNFQNQYLVLSTKNNRAYFHNDNNWQRVNVDVRDFDNEFACFTYKDRIYLEDKELVELAFKNNTFVTMSVKNMNRNISPYQIYGSVYGKKLYTLFTYDITYIGLDEYDMENGKTAHIIKNKQWYDQDLLIDNSFYEIGSLHFLINLDNNKFIENDTLINTFPQ